MTRNEPFSSDINLGNIVFFKIISLFFETDNVLHFITNDCIYLNSPFPFQKLCVSIRFNLLKIPLTSVGFIVFTYLAGTFQVMYMILH